MFILDGLDETHSVVVKKDDKFIITLLPNELFSSIDRDQPWVLNNIFCEDQLFYKYNPPVSLIPNHISSMVLPEIEKYGWKEGDQISIEVDDHDIKLRKI